MLTSAPRRFIATISSHGRCIASNSRIQSLAWPLDAAAKVYVHGDDRTPSVRLCLALTQRPSQLACATRHGFALIEDGALRYLSRPIPADFQPFTRFNDGACDQKGRFVAGTLFNKGQDVPGQLYIYDAERDVCEVLDPGPFTVGCFPNDASVVIGS